MKRVTLISTCFIAMLFICTTTVYAHTDFDPNGDNSIQTDTSKLDETIFNVVEKVPLFPGCDEADWTERKNCAQRKMLLYIYGNLKYPEEARNNGIEGTTGIKFVIASDGTLQDFEIPRPIGNGFDEEALRVIKSMPTWEPGLSKGEPVNVKYTIPVRFRLDTSPTKTKKNKKVKKKAGKNKN